MQAVGDPKMSFSVYGQSAASILSVAIAMDRLPCYGIFVGEHIIYPAEITSTYPYGDMSKSADSDIELVDIWVMFGALSSVTSALRLYASISIIALRHPLLIARSCVTLQALSEGRFNLGVGAGWLREEFVALDQPFESRGSRTDESLSVIKRALEGGHFSHQGQGYKFDALTVTTEPVRLPVMIGGSSSFALRRAARYGDAWYSPSTLSLDDCIASRTTIEGLRRQAGRGDLPFEYVVKISADADSSVVSKYHSAGFSHLVVPMNIVWRQRAHHHQADLIADLEEVLENVTK
jgi:probable F420-dependent oxidoreductase